MKARVAKPPTLTHSSAVRKGTETRFGLVQGPFLVTSGVDGDFHRTDDEGWWVQF